jgi:ubiquinone/menaquinone biosynthesis C-methylase UbiE
MDTINQHAFDAALEYLCVQSGEKVLEIGFGTGKLVSMLASQTEASLIAGVDPSELMLATARRRNIQEIKSGRVDLRLGEAGALCWPNETFHAVCALHNFQFWSEPVGCLRETFRVLKSGGRLFMVLRAHPSENHSRRRLANPLSRSGDEVSAALRAFATCGYVDCDFLGNLRWKSAILIARKPQSWA